MAVTPSDAGFIVWGIDQAPYGPVELPTLISWVKDERVTTDSWIFTTQTSCWQKAAQVPELQMFFRSKAKPTGGAAVDDPAVSPGALRRVKILAGLSEAHLGRLIHFLEVQRLPQFAVVVKQGDHGDSMYLILEGELRVRLNVMGKETVLATLGAGEFFGDIALLDQGPRSADVVANVESLVAKLTTTGFQTLGREAPEVALSLLHAISRTLTARIRADNKRFGDSVRFSRVAEA